MLIAFADKTKKVSNITLLEICPEFQPEQATDTKCKTQTSKGAWPSWATNNHLSPDDIPIELVCLSSDEVRLISLICPFLKVQSHQSIRFVNDKAPEQALPFYLPFFNSAKCYGETVPVVYAWRAAVVCLRVLALASCKNECVLCTQLCVLDPLSITIIIIILLLTSLLTYYWYLSELADSQVMPH